MFIKIISFNPSFQNSDKVIYLNVSLIESISPDEDNVCTLIQMKGKRRYWSRDTVEVTLLALGRTN